MTAASFHDPDGRAVRDAIEVARGLRAPDLPNREDRLRTLRPAARRVLLPALETRIVALLHGAEGGPEGGPDLIACADAFATLRPLVEGEASHGMGPRLPAAIAAAIRGRATACTGALQAALAGDDFPDLPALSLDLLRLEALRWVVEVLGDRRAVDELAHLSRRIARVALLRATATIDAFLHGRDLLALYDNASVVAQVDNLLVVALRLLDARAGMEEERTAFVETADQQALDDFLRVLGLLTDALLAMLDKAAARPGRGGTFFRSLVRQLDCIGRFCAGLDHGHRPPRVEAITASIGRRLPVLAERVAEVLDRAVADATPDAPAALVHADELAVVLARCGEAAAAGRLILRARVARRALGSGAA